MLDQSSSQSLQLATTATKRVVLETARQSYGPLLILLHAVDDHELARVCSISYAGCHARAELLPVFWISDDRRA